MQTIYPTENYLTILNEWFAKAIKTHHHAHSLQFTELCSSINIHTLCCCIYVAKYFVSFFFQLFVFLLFIIIL